ncbi:MAG: hypothetical protein M5U01_11140 [Ardenticatenaceae bacterium]|nr:hypothetical protein [Ardenticatenaceae bacterium]HBY94261.1 hypothetical protein [Chloroflexota bacterium]
MDYLDPVTVWSIVNARQQECVKEWEVRRLLKEAQAGRLRLQDRLLLRAGDFFIAFGLRLKERYAPAGQADRRVSAPQRTWHPERAA